MRHKRRHIGKHNPRGLFSRITYAFRERQIYLRSEGEVQFITLRPWVQVAVIAAFTAGLFWVAYATVNIAFKDQVLALKERNQYRARLEYEDRIGEMRTTVDKLNRRLLLDQKAYLAKVDEVRSEHDRLVDRHEQLAAFFRSGRLPGGQGNTSDEQPEKQGSLTPRGTIVGGSATVQARTNVSPSASQKYISEFSSAHEVLQPLQDLRTYMAEMERREARLVDDTTSYMASENTRLADVYRRLSINAASVAEASSYQPEAVGGPFIAATTADLGSQLLAEKVASLARELDTWETLKFEATRLPLFRPMTPEYETSSTFGLRKDPFRGRPAMHAGIDFRARTGSPVRVTAAGKVIKAGWAGGYGKMVEVRHDNGVTTRYAHLSIISVRTGQKVKPGDTIGKVGSTGRSTGPHLHYETRVGGRAIDPVKFWKARDVFQEITR
jgi:murein DD-endopeptidase MepM/ murein hydrolase activator NlpD